MANIKTVRNFYGYLEGPLEAIIAMRLAAY